MSSCEIYIPSWWGPGFASVRTTQALPRRVMAGHRVKGRGQTHSKRLKKYWHAQHAQRSELAWRATGSNAYAIHCSVSHIIPTDRFGGGVGSGKSSLSKVYAAAFATNIAEVTFEENSGSR